MESDFLRFSLFYLFFFWFLSLDSNRLSMAHTQKKLCGIQSNKTFYGLHLFKIPNSSDSNAMLFTASKYSNRKIWRRRLDTILSLPNDLYRLHSTVGITLSVKVDPIRWTMLRKSVQNRYVAQKSMIWHIQRFHKCKVLRRS